MKVRARAYFDESGNEELPGYFGVAGLVGSDNQWSVFDRLWKETLETTGAPYLHMREFAHSVDAFTEWKDDKARREQLMAGVVAAVLQSELTAVGSALRVGDFDALTEEQRIRLQSPYFFCLQDVLWGFALTNLDEDPKVEVHVSGDRHGQHEDKARKLHRAMRRAGGLLANLSDELTGSRNTLAATGVARARRCRKVVRAVPDAILCRVLRMHSRLHIEIMTRRRSRWSTCRPLLAHRAESAHQRPVSSRCFATKGRVGWLSS